MSKQSDMRRTLCVALVVCAVVVTVSLTGYGQPKMGMILGAAVLTVGLSVALAERIRAETTLSCADLRSVIRRLRLINPFTFPLALVLAAFGWGQEALYVFELGLLLLAGFGLWSLMQRNRASKIRQREVGVAAHKMFYPPKKEKKSK
jgi:hypothetical protein